MNPPSATSVDFSADFGVDVGADWSFAAAGGVAGAVAVAPDCGAAVALPATSVVSVVSVHGNEAGAVPATGARVRLHPHRLPSEGERGPGSPGPRSISPAVDVAQGLTDTRPRS
jgi:hypothetical protein